jgi:hypothetical protein
VSPRSAGVVSRCHFWNAWQYIILGHGRTWRSSAPGAAVASALTLAEASDGVEDPGEPISPVSITVVSDQAGAGAAVCITSRDRRHGVVVLAATAQLWPPGSNASLGQQGREPWLSTPGYPGYLRDIGGSSEHKPDGAGTRSAQALGALMSVLTPRTSLLATLDWTESLRSCRAGGQMPCINRPQAASPYSDALSTVRARPHSMHRDGHLADLGVVRVAARAV